MKVRIFIDESEIFFFDGGDRQKLFNEFLVLAFISFSNSFSLDSKLI